MLHMAMLFEMIISQVRHMLATIGASDAKVSLRPVAIRSRPEKRDR